jgi:hypothetical protein
VANLCGTDVSNVTEVRTYRDDPTSVNEAGENGVALRIEPTPATSTATLRVTSPSATTARLVITNAAGAVVMDRTIELAAGENTYPVETTDLGASGVYGVRIEHPAAVIMSRIVVVR